VIKQIWTGSSVSCKPRLHGLKGENDYLTIQEPHHWVLAIRNYVIESLCTEPRVTVSVKKNDNS